MKAPLTAPSPASEGRLPSVSSACRPCDDPADGVIASSALPPTGNGPVVGGNAVGAMYLQCLIEEREPSLQDLLLERDPWPELYTPIGTMLEEQVRGLVHDWNGRIPK